LLNVSVAGSSNYDGSEQTSCTAQDDVFSFFYSRNFGCCGRLNLYEKLRQNSLLDSHGDNLRNCVCRRSARVQEERQELSDERRQGVQLRQELQLLAKAEQQQTLLTLPLSKQRSNALRARCGAHGGRRSIFLPALLGL
jgi:hypothetical protein